VGCAAQLWLASSGTKNTSMRLVVAALGILVVANVAQGAEVLGDGQTWDGGLVIALRMTFLVLLGAAALLPSMATTSAASTTVALPPWWRFALLTALAGLAPLSVVLADALLGRETDYRGLFVGTLILFTTVIARLGFLGRSLNRSAGRVLSLNVAGNRLVQALTIEQIHDVARGAVTRILEDDDAAVWLVTNDTVCQQRGGGLYDESGARTVRVLKPGHAVHAYFGVEDDVYFVVVPLDTSIGGSNQLAISTARAPSRSSRATLIQLSDSVAHAIDRVRYAERTAERESDERLQRLLHDASDVIAVLDADLAVTYVTPAVSRMLGL
jgi:PAS domain-containing protein